MTRTCPHCHESNPDPAQRCLHCDAPLAGATPPPAPPRGHLCPANRHPMDPGWDECPYCKADPPPARRQTVVESPPRGDTVLETPPPRPADLPPPPKAPGARRRRRQTVFDDAAAGGEAGMRAGAGQRKIVALLVTYSWDPAGQVFPVRQGRTDLGRSDDCDVRVPGDDQMSSRHATIVHRERGFWIDDEKSMNGTWVDGSSVETKQPLTHGTRIRTGATTWRFLVVDPESEG